MRKWFDIVLIGLLALNLYRTWVEYTPDTEVLGTTIPTWLAVAVQLLCIAVLGYKVYRDYAADKQI